MRFPLEVVEAVRAEWPADRPLFVRVSAIDGSEGGITLDDTLALAGELRARGVDGADLAGPRLAGRGRLLTTPGPWTGPDPVQVTNPG